MAKKAIRENEADEVSEEELRATAETTFMNYAGLWLFGYEVGLHKGQQLANGENSGTAED